MKRTARPSSAAAGALATTSWAWFSPLARQPAAAAARTASGPKPLVTGRTSTSGPTRARIAARLATMSVGGRSAQERRDVEVVVVVGVERVLVVRGEQLRDRRR